MCHENVSSLSNNLKRFADDGQLVVQRRHACASVRGVQAARSDADKERALAPQQIHGRRVASGLSDQRVTSRENN